jgi:threonine dehydrogenase-like Zn-dependent dehydrogenase
MKAVVIHAARDLRVEERENESPGAGQVEIAIEAGGICGSDLHYFNHGGFGTVRVREPMILGHEVAGTIKALGAAVSGLVIGDRVAGVSEPALQRLRLLPEGPAEPVSEHALLRQRDADAAHTRRVSPAPGR